MKNATGQKSVSRSKSRSKTKRSDPLTVQHVTYRSLRGWAISTLLETHAIIECHEHGHIRDCGSWAHGWDEARQVAKSHPFAGSTARACVGAIDEVMASVGDVCPDCPSPN